MVVKDALRHPMHLQAIIGVITLAAALVTPVVYTARADLAAILTLSATRRI
jgi:hypothetical protein